MMKTLRRFTTTILASFDRMVSQIENHEALVDAAIRDIQKSGARARVQLKRVAQDGKRMRQRLCELRDAADQWSQRAVLAAREDEQRALECLRRRKRALSEIAALEEQERAHATLEKQLHEDLRRIDERLVALRQQRNLLRTRQSRSEALRAVQAEDGRVFGEIDEIFDRWEAKVSEYELQGSCEVSSEDTFEEEFSQQEEEAELRELLATLLESDGQSGREECQ